MGEFEFDEDTRLTGEGPAFGTRITGRWDAFAGVNGGFMLALCARGLAQVMPFPDPVAVSGFYLRPGSHGPGEIRTSVLRTGKTTAFGQASLWQDGKERVHATAAFSDLSKAGLPNAGLPNAAGSVYTGGAAPALPPPADCYRFPAGALRGAPIADRIDYRSTEEPGWIAGKPSGNPLAEFWMRFRDGREPDLASLPLFVDAAAPAAMEVGVLSTTVELTVHLRARPEPGWLACRALTRYVAGGYHEEDFEIWDSAGTLVAQSRQLALLLQ
jgi:acyl-coenzyme A thioesterase PaaI-like protein